MPPRYADKRYYVTADRSRVVDEGDPEAALLLAAEGAPVAEEDVQRYSLELPGEGVPRAANPGAAGTPPGAPAQTLEEEVARLEDAKARGMGEEVRARQEILRRDHGAAGAKAAAAVGDFAARDAVTVEKPAPGAPTPLSRGAPEPDAEAAPRRSRAAGATPAEEKK